jgi:hypothetical protein
MKIVFFIATFLIGFGKILHCSAQETREVQILEEYKSCLAKCPPIVPGRAYSGDCDNGSPEEVCACACDKIKDADLKVEAERSKKIIQQQNSWMVNNIVSGKDFKLITFSSAKNIKKRYVFHGKPLMPGTFYTFLKANTIRDSTNNLAPEDFFCTKIISFMPDDKLVKEQIQYNYSGDVNAAKEMHVAQDLMPTELLVFLQNTMRDIIYQEYGKYRITMSPRTTSSNAQLKHCEIDFIYDTSNHVGFGDQHGESYLVDIMSFIEFK